MLYDCAHDVAAANEDKQAIRFSRQRRIGEANRKSILRFLSIVFVFSARFLMFFIEKRGVRFQIACHHAQVKTPGSAPGKDR